MGSVIGEWERERERVREMEMEWGEQNGERLDGGDVDLERGQLVDVSGENAGMLVTRGRAAPGVSNSWMMMGEVIRARLVDARLVGGMTVISASWVAVGGYLGFIKLKMWLRERFWSS